MISKTTTYVVSFFVGGTSNSDWNGYQVFTTRTEMEMRAAANEAAQVMSEELGVSRERITWKAVAE